MAAKTKAVGVRLPLDLIERIEQYQKERGVNFTEALTGLVEKGLGGERETVEVLNSKLDERITVSIKQLLDTELNERITNLINDKLNVMLDKRMTEEVKQPLDTELDKSISENIPSDDSSNSESIAEDVKIIPTDGIEQVDGEIPESLSWGDFHKRLDLPTTGNPSKAKGDIAIATAKRKGHGTWVMNSTTRKFTKLTEDD